MVRHFCFVAILTLLFTSGCGGDGAQGGKVVPVFEVTGKIEYAGAPLTNAVISFAPLDKQPVATGRTNGQGVYVLTTYDFEDGAAEGNYKVLISKRGVKKGAGGEEAHSDDFEPPTHDDEGTGDENSLLPSEYESKDTTPLKAKVDPNGDNVFDFKI